MQRRINVKTLLVVLAVGLLVGAAVGMAQAQNAGAPPGGMEAYHGYAGPAVSYPSDYNGFRNVDGWDHNIQAGGYAGYPTDYSNGPNTSGWIHMSK
jgi:hypothetical protein